jgi:hypothetical protein
MNKLNESQNYQEDMSFVNEQILTDPEMHERHESLFNESNMFSHRDSFNDKEQNPDVSISQSRESTGSQKRRLSIKKIFGQRKKISQGSVVKTSSLDN